MTEKKPPVLCLLGPTASGKTGLAVALRERYNVDIISVDSALVYKRMDIGTAKPDAETLRVAPHALVNLIEPWESYSVSRFTDDVTNEIMTSVNSGRLPVLAGGTMLYFNALWNGLSALPPSQPAVREKLEQQAAQSGLPSLHAKLAAVDPESAGRINQNDPQRLLRALEVFEITGVPLSSLQNHRSTPGEFDFLNIGLFPQDRSLLHSRIEQRFHEMLESGFENEVRNLLSDSRISAASPAMRCVGYRQMLAYLDGTVSYDEMVLRGIAATRQLAKRQMTWMRKMPDLHLFDITVDIEALLSSDCFTRWAARHQLW
jgi:tRNA dimethylallyltransferase